MYHVCGHCLTICGSSQPSQCQKNFNPLLPRSEYLIRRADHGSGVDLSAGQSLRSPLPEKVVDSLGRDSGSGLLDDGKKMSSSESNGFMGNGSALKGCRSAAFGSGSHGFGSSVKKLAGDGSRKSSDCSVPTEPVKKHSSMSGLASGTDVSSSSQQGGHQFAAGVQLGTSLGMAAAVRSAVQSSRTPVFCQLPNLSGADCYANSAVECLAACPEVVKLIREHPLYQSGAFCVYMMESLPKKDGVDLSAGLEGIILYGTKRVDLLRGAVSGEFAEEGQRDGAQFFFELVHPGEGVRMQKMFRHLFLLYERVETTCRMCSYHQLVGSSDGEVLQFVKISPIGKHLSLGDWFDDYCHGEDVKKSCSSSSCSSHTSPSTAGAQRHSLKRTVIMNRAVEYVAVQFERQFVHGFDRDLRPVYLDNTVEVLSSDEEPVTFKDVLVEDDNGVKVLKGGDVPEKSDFG